MRKHETVIRVPVGEPPSDDCAVEGRLVVFAGSKGWPGMLLAHAGHLLVTCVPVPMCREKRRILSTEPGIRGGQESLCVRTAPLFQSKGRRQRC